MSEKIDGGPAFPVSTSSRWHETSGPYGHQDGSSTWQFPGMTIRDYFAAKAMPLVEREWATPHDDQLLAISKLCYRIADAMLGASI